MKKMLLTLAALFAAATSALADLYVTPTGAGNKDGSSWANAFAGIQAAVDAVDAAVAADANYAIPTIRVADGTYTRVVVSRNMALDVRSENGAAATIIDGFNTNGCIRCYANGSFRTPTFTGFTLRNGNVDILPDQNGSRYGGGASGGTLYDCIVEDCIANWGGGTYSADTWRCIIRRCTATGGGGACAEGGTHRNTLMCQSTGQSFLTYGVTLYNCTVVDNVAERSGTNVHVNRRYNSIVWGNLAAGQPVEQNDAVDPKLVGDGDYRLRVGSPAIDGGDATYSTEGYVGLTDLAGNARVQGNAIDRGCYEGPGVEGCLVTAVAGGNGVVSPTSFFTNETMSVTITADTSVYGRPVTAWYTNGVLAASGGNSLTVVMSGNGDIEVTAMFATYEWFVNGATGSDSNDGLSAATAFKTIAKAVSSATNDETINVAAGTYAPIDTTGRRINILGTAGAAATIIDGGDSQRCALLSDGTTLTGFTLQHGRSITSDDMQGGGGAMGGTLVACVLKDNIASYGGGALGSTLIRCTVTDNSAAFGGGVHRCQAYNSLIAYNSATRGGGARFGELRGCTVVYNRGCLSGGIEYATVLNSILRYNRTANGRPSYNLWNYEGNCIDEPNVNDEDGEWLDGYTIVEDPLFVDPENGDFRLLAGSPCINYGDVNFYYVDDGLDLAGNPRIVDDDPDLGCYEGEVEGYVVSVRVDGHGSVSARTIVVAEGGSATITATADGRAFLRWLVDGENAGTSTTLTLSNIDADHVVTACFQRNTTTVSGSGAALQNAINAAKDGDTLVVSPGTYSAIVATNRVLDIKSSAGPETTIIQGTNNGLLSGTRAATFSLTVTRPTCTLSGFTLTGGFCGDPIYGGGGVFGGIVSNCVIRGNGALIGGGAAYSMLSHCVISNNTAYVLGGGAAFLALDNCLVTGNEVQFNTIEWVRRLAATLGINLNIPADFGGGAGVAYAAADHCTITKNTATAAEAGGGFWVVLDNSIVAGNTATAEGANQNLFNTPVSPLYTCTTYEDFWGEIDPPGFVNAATDDTFVNAAAGDFRLKATSACVDGCDGTFDLENPDMERIALLENGTDLVGSPRWLALAPDIGCYETTPAKPGAVPDVAATRSAYREDVRVSWTGVKHGAWYTIHRGPWNNGAGTFAQAEQIGIVTNVFTWYVDDTAEASVDYRYWVVAHSGAGSGPYGAGDHGYWVAPLVITTESLPDGTVREPWSAQLAATGGIGTYTWEVTQPDWLSFSGATLSGLPRVQGDVWVVVTVMDQRGTEAQKAFQISIAKNPNPQNITISNLAELRQFMEDVHEYYFEGDTVTLTADIDCEGGRFNTGASGSSAYSCFKGTFDGQGHVISNFVNTALSAGTGNTTTFGVAMFDIARDGAVIKNLTLRGHFGHEASHEYAAAFAAYAIGHTNGTLGLTLENCHFIGSVTNYKCSAAFVGAALHGSGAPDGRVLYMTNCTARGSIVSTYTYTVGGLVASGEGVEAYDCSMEGEVRGRWTLGGLIGQAFDSSFKNCSFEGTMGPGPGSGNCSNGGCGGLVGLASNSVFRACTAAGDIAWDVSHNYLTDGRASSYNFVAVGGAAGVTCGDSAFYDCTAEGRIAAAHGYAGGFVGWTAGAEVFTNCTTSVELNPDGFASGVKTGNAGFAASVASDGGLFVDCTTSSKGKAIQAGFYCMQTPRKNVEVGSNTFLRCHAEGVPAEDAGFCKYSWNGTFKDCTVRGGSASAGFVYYAGQNPKKSIGYAQTTAQTSLFEDCAVVGTRAAGAGFVFYANTDGSDGSALCTNVFRRCRAGCLLGNSSGSYARGFAYGLFKGTLVEDCAAYGVTMLAGATYGFAEKISIGATVRRCVGAVLPRATEDIGAGFADSISYTAPVEDCYSVYAPPAIPQYGYQGGFVLSASVGYNSTGPAITRCFALAAPPDASDQTGRAGSFCGSVNNTSYANFIDCYRPAESAVRDVGNIGDDAGVSALAKAQFANATVATMPNYDFQNVWRSPQGVASSPYLAASTDGGSNFWFAAAVVSGEGSILVNGEAPRESYPIGTVLTVRAVPTHPDCPFTGWVGEGFADPLAQETTYTVRNVSAIGATFGTPIYTVEDFFAIPDNASDAYVLMNDLDFTEHLSTNHYFQSVDNFQGKFFGQGHTIRYACTNSVSTEGAAAPFSSLTTGAQLRDLTVESVVSNCYGKAAGLVASIGNGVLVSNCHARLVGTAKPYPNSYDQEASCQYFGFVRTVSGTDIRIVDCTAEIKALANCSAAGFADTVSMTGGEIARCAAFAEIVATNDYCNSRYVSVSGGASGFAHYLSLSGGATVRECFSAGVVDAAANAAGFAYEISMRDDESQVRDCYSTAEVLSGASRNPAGFACRISDNNDEGGVTVSNCWFGGSVRVRGNASDYYKPYGFAYYLDGDVSFENCAWIEVPGANEAGTAGVTALPQATSRQAASWPGYDFTNVWSMTDGATTPYFAWSLADGTGFRLFAVQEPGTTITHPATALPGSNAAVSADPGETGAFFCSWAGAGAYANAGATPTTLLADNHRTVRAVWGKAIRTRAELEAIADDPAGTYALGCDIDLGGEPWTPLCQDEYTPFTGTIYGNGHTISNLTVETETARAGLFGGLGAGATIADLNLANPVVRGANCVGTLAGYVEGATIGGCTVSGADVTATSERAGCFVGQIVGNTSVSRCSVIGDIVGSDRYVGGFVGSVANSTVLEKCFALADVSGPGEGTGGFVGYAEDSPSFSECFACGSVTSTGNSAGGFAGYLYETPSISDCYALVDAKGGSYVGGFVGQIYYYYGAVTRCYSAGSASGSSEIGGFAGRQYRGTPTFTDCFRISDSLADVGAAAVAGVTALSDAAMHATNSFAAFHAPGGKWAQVDGTTHPYFAWSLVDGKMTLGATVSGESAGCSVSGAGAYLPGATATVTAVPGGSALFLAWTGNAPYADPNAATTTLPVDNFRVVNAEFGTLISTRADLAAISENPSGIYGLGADIDLAGTDWTPLCNDSSPFTGTLYGRGHTISNLTVDTGGNYYAGLFGYISGGTVSDVRFVNPVVRGGTYTGTLVGRMTGASTVSGCSAIGATVEGGERTGGLVGDMQDSSTLARSFFLGDVTATGQYIGGLVGVVYKSGSSVSECFACGSVSSTSGYVGGLVGWVGSGPAISDCYALERVRGTDRVGGFVGHAETSSTSFRRCYAAGGDTDGSSNVGGFVGYRYSSPTFSDCIVLGDAGGVDGIASLDRAGMLQRANFASYHATGKWSQIDGKTQPYFDWGLVGGKMTLGATVSGESTGCSVSGAGAYAPGATATVTAVPGGSALFLAWTGNASYADPNAATTTLPVDNFRVVNAEFGTLISTRADLAAIAANPSGIYGLGADIDLAGADWTPLCNDSSPFTGMLYGRGHTISNLTVNLGSTAYAGLFGCIGGGTVSDVRLVNPVVKGGRYTATLAGRMIADSTVSGCSAIGATVEAAGERSGGLIGDMQPRCTLARSFFLGDVTATGQYIGGLVGVVSDSSRVTECFACGTVSSTTSYVGGFGGWIGSSSSVSDCYANAIVSGTDRVGSFVGHAQNNTTVFTRCYAAGSASGSSNAGGFAGYLSYSPVLADCFAQTPSTAMAGVTVLDAAGMRSTNSLAAFRAAGCWSQIDGLTQPYFAWGLVDGGFLLSGDAATITGLGAHAPGTQAPISVDPTGGIFLGWTGGATYADASSASTTVLADNYRTVSAALGTLITTRAQLEAVGNSAETLSGYYALGADIDLSGSPWTPLGTFTGSLYGHGHKITGLTFSNTSSGDSNGSHAGLFRYASGATFDGIHFEGVSIRGYQYTGALAGELQGATAVRNCSAQGVVTNSNGYAGLLVGQVYGSGTSFENCAATGTVYSSSTSSSDCGGLVGRVYYSPASFTDCDVNVEVSGAGGNDKGGFIGAVRDGSAGATFTRCTASGAVASSNSDYVGGFLGYANKAVSCTDCSATGAVTGKNGTGGFAGNIDSVAHSFTRCVAAGDASGTQNVGGFVGSTSGGNTQFVECEAQGKATGSSGSHAGGFVGQTTGTGTRFARCTAMGDASAPSEQVGGFAGYLNNSNDVWRCRSFGSASGTFRVGGFVGYLYSGNTAIRESFAIGDAAATRTTDEALAGGFAGQVNTSARLSDCYAIGVASGGYCVGGFAGKFVNSSISVTRCYAAGGIECAGTYGGAFVGNSGQYGTLADCAAARSVIAPYHAVGTATAGESATLAGVSEFTAAEFRLRANFQAFHETGLWSQVNGSTQPYLAWGLVDGKMSLAGKPVGALGGSISGLGLYEPGATATIRAVTTGNAVFLGWTGNAPYADPDAAQTTIVLDNFRCVVASFGTSITTAADLAGIADKLDGTYALGADIDLSGSAWTPLGASTPFTGTLKGNGHVITGLSFSDTSNSDTGGNYAGLFRHVQDATIEDIHLEGVSLSGNKYVGALAGEVKGATTIRNCSAEGTVTANGEQAGLLVGRVTGAGTTFSNCAATGAVVSASSSVGGLVGYANVAVTFEDCDAAVAVSGKGNAVGGFIGKTETAAPTFTRCSASGDVSNTSDTTGGFAGQSTAAGTVFENCVAEGAVSGTSYVGGFIGYASGGNSQFVECDALGTVKSSSNYAGGFVGQTAANGIRYALCRALGGVSSTSYDVGGFVGKISNSNDVWRCMSAGSASGTYDVGGFVGNFDGANTAIRECFALGDATSTRTGNNDAVAGGFAGRIGNTNPKISDSYCLGAVSAAARVAGGFAGKFDSGTISLTRCYAAGTVDCPGTYVGAFVGTTNTYAAAISDCAVLCDGILGVGLSTAGANDTLEGVAEYDAAGMKSAANFQTWLAIDDLDGSVWAQSDGVSQPYLAWSAPGGKLTIYESIGGWARGRVDGAGEWYEPGTVVEIAAVSDEGFLVDWTGSTPYADPTASPTTIPLDNHRVAAVRFGKLITTADELDAVRNDLGGIYGLGADIDLAGRDWTPIGFNNAKFTGTFYGFGYEVKNMVCTNSPGSSYHGLFGWTEGATLDGVKVSGVVRSTSQYTGGLVGVANATTIRGCHADVTVSSTAYYTGGLVGGIGAGTTISGCSSKGSVTSTSDYAGGLAGAGGGGNFEIRDCVSSVETVGSAYVGGLIGSVTGGDVVISDCRADGYACCTSKSVGGFIGNVGSALTISNCVARGDVRCKNGATYAGYGGFVGYMNGDGAVIADSWCSGAVWGLGANCGAFVGYSRYGTVRNCSIYAFGAGPRPFSGSDGNLNGGSLTASQIELLSKDENGDPWPTVKNHAHSATKIRTVEDLFAVTNNLDGIYALANDINLGGAAWTPIGNASAGFTGEFYGENHCISNFVVNSSVSGAGLFGCIAGGRVNGVRAYGSVTGSNEQVGGFVGRLAQMSLVDGCSFSGTVSGSQYVVGGFAGRICDSPVVLRSCAVNCTVTFTGEGGSYKSAYAGGFVGAHDAGYVMDCYAVADVSSLNQARYVGGFAGNVSSGRITTSWCAGSAETTGSYLGAFAGTATSGYITKSYYDSGKTSLLAVNNTAYDGITPLTSSEMLHAANFPDFDFDRTWLIDEGETTPYLQTFIVVKRGFDVWTEQAGYPEGTEPGDVVDGIPAGVRYIYSIPAEATGLYALAGEEFFHVVTDAYGNPCVKFRAKRDPYEGVRVIETVYATTDLADMADPDPANWPHRVQMRYDALTDTWHPANGVYPPAMFFRWRIDLERVEE